jgi:membrane protease YdiL (CAAX protease family)
MEVEENKLDSVQMLQPAPRPCGFWATMGLSCAIAIVSLGVCIVTAVGYIIVSKIKNPELDIVEFASSFESSSTFFAVIAIELAILVIGLVLLFSKIRKNITVKQYLYLSNPGSHQFLKWSLILLLYVGIVELMTFGLTFTGRPFISEFMVHTYTTVRFKSVLLFAVLIAAPLYEELFFRGFMFRGIENSRMGPIGAAIITSFLWSVTHTQYDAFGITFTFLGGLLLSWALVKTKSIYVPIVLHALWNLIATIEVALYLKLS